MKKTIKKFLSIFLIINIIVATLPIAVYATSGIKPSYSVSGPNVSSVNVGGTVIYTVTYNNATNINLSASHVILNGFTANVNISASGNTRIISLTNIQGTSGNKSIGIAAGSASNNGEYSLGVSNSYAFTLNVPYVDNVRPSISISKPSVSSVYSGGTVSYTISMADNVKVTSVNLSASYVVLNGFTANVSVTGSGNTRVVTLSNIQGNIGNKSIAIRAAAAVDSAGNQTNATPSSVAFNIITKPVSNNTTTSTKKSSGKKSNATNTNSNTSDSTTLATTSVQETIAFKKSEPVIKSGCEDSTDILGDINKEVTTFKAWLKVEKTNAKYVVQNNFAVQGEESIYFVEYYNGSKEAISNVSLSLTIPKGTDVTEISGDGYISDQTSSKTIIGWKLSNVQSGAKCRVYVKVKYITDENLVKSNDISQEFFANLKVSANGEISYSYLRQLFIDKSQNKTGTIKRYLTSLNNAENIRPEDEITRAELAKMIVDTGIFDEEKSDKEYKEYKDSKEIPSYSRDAISILTKLNIMEGYKDGNFKPNNPILKDDMLKIIALVSEYMSDKKLKVSDSVFVNTKILKTEDEKVSEQKDYIMELVRQNIIENADVNVDEYTLRKDAVEVINALTFRGPYEENIPEDTIKFKDVSKDSKYFYNIVGATNSYKYTYTDSLVQKIIEVEK